MKDFPEYWNISLALRYIGDRWSLLIVRELLFGQKGFNELSRALPDLSRGLLSQRLKKMHELNIIRRIGFEKNSSTPSYELTSSGYALSDVLKTMGMWASHWQSPFEHDLKIGVQTLLENMCKTINLSALPEEDIAICFNFPQSSPDPLRGWIVGRNNKYSTQFEEPSRLTQLNVEVDPQILYELWWGIRKCENAKKDGDIGFIGPPGWGEQMSSWFIPT